MPLVVAAGMDDGSFGTDAVAILAALEEADEGAGAVVLMDLGSAVLSAELALELMDDDARSRVLLCPAPLVEGLVVAAVAAVPGASREQVAVEALSALEAKQVQLSPPGRPGAVRRPDVGADSEDDGDAVGHFTVTSEHGLHARPAARLVQLVQGLGVAVQLRNMSTGSDWVPGASMLRVTTLGALHGHDVEVRASGDGARDAVDQVLALANRNFDDV